MRIRPLARWLLLLALPAVSPPAHAARWIVCGNYQRDFALATPDGDVLVFNAPGVLLARHSFGSGLRGLTIAPQSTLVDVLLAGEHTSVASWDYATDKLTGSALGDRLDGAMALCYASGGHAVFVAVPRTGEVAVLASDLSYLRSVAVPGLNTSVTGCDVNTSPRDWFIALATPGAVWQGRCSATELQRMETATSTNHTPLVTFSADDRELLVAGDAALLRMPLPGGPVVAVPAGQVRFSAAFGLSSSPEFGYLASDNLLQVVQLDTGALHLSGVVRPAPAEPLEAAVSARWGTAAIVYRDGLLYWFRPTQRELVATWPGPASPLVKPALPVLPGPGDATEETLRRFGVVAQLVTNRNVFVTDAEPKIYVLDGDYQHMADLEQAGRQNGWDQLVQALVARALRRPDLAPAPFRPLLPRMAEMDLVQLPSVHLAPGVTPAMLESALGKRQPTDTEGVTAEGKVQPVLRFGPFGLPLDNERFPTRASPMVTQKYLAAYAGTP
ncbi:MAG: hypothetical protein HYU66_25980 [Armatimonadetes bacterium]|nr:hypothetical protein [Armatimonadota bacterium]